MSKKVAEITASVSGAKVVNGAYKLKVAENSPVYVGDPQKTRFVPSVILKRWGEESKLSLRLALESEVKSHYVKGDVVTVATEKAAFNVYQKENEESLEVEAVFGKRPERMTLEFKLGLENLVAFYQKSLTEEYAEKDCSVYTDTRVKLKTGREINRPENVVGSYAVYHATKRNGKYKTGKAFHIYRPKLVDAKGKTAWCSFNVDAEKTGKLEITMPESFFDTAVFPVVLDPTFGYTSAGGTNGTQGGDSVWSTIFSLTETGNVSSISVYAKKVDDPCPARTGIYAVSGTSPTDKLAESDEQELGVDAAWITFNLSLLLLSGSYALALATNDHYHYWDWASNDYNEYYTEYTGGLPDPFIVGYHDALSVQSIFATYSTSGCLINGYPIEVESGSLQCEVGGVNAEWVEWENGEAVEKMKGYGGSRGWSFTCFEDADAVDWADSVAYLLESVVDAKTAVSLTLDFGDKHSLPAGTTVSVIGVRVWYSAGMKVRYFTITVKRAP